jgi:hypothetical protein
MVGVWLSDKWSMQLSENMLYYCMRFVMDRMSE